MYDNYLQIGEVGEVTIASKFVQNGFHVLVPFSQNIPYDFVVDYQGELFKIQVKSTNKCKDGRMFFSVVRQNAYNLTKRPYEKGEVDYFGLYCVENQWCGLISLSDIKSTQVTINMNKPKNNVYKNYRMFDDYDFDRKVQELITGKQVPLIDRTSDINSFSQISGVSDDYAENVLSKITDREILKNDIRNMSMADVGRKYKKSPTTIRRWCDYYSLPSTKKAIETYSDEEWFKI